MKKLKNLNLKTKIRLVTSFFLLTILVICATTFLKTYTEYVSNPAYPNGIVGNVVHVNSLEKDYYYYMGKNYTDSSLAIPTGDNQRKYNDNTLVQTIITYHGLDNSNTYHGYVSETELQDTFVYYDYYYVNNNGTVSNKADDYVEILLIDNPFYKRPTNKGFNGWLTSYVGATIRYDYDYYERYVKIPITYTNNKPNNIDISFYASWVNSTVSNLTTDSQNGWRSANNSLKEKVMQEVTGTTITYEDILGYYVKNSILQNSYFPNDSYDETGIDVSNTMCLNIDGCFYYALNGSDIYDRNETYYELVSGLMTVHNVTYTLTDINSNNNFSSLINMSGYYKLVNIPNGSSYAGYYDINGVYQTTGVCDDNRGCNYYELIQYYTNNTPNIYDHYETYYYLATRDTNFIIMRTNISTAWPSSVNKPFTLTSIYNGNDYTNYYLQTTNIAIKCYSDIAIENIYIYSNKEGVKTIGTLTNSNNASTYFYGNWNNVKIGRNIITDGGNYVAFIGIFGGANAPYGDDNDYAHYKIIVESGTYTVGSILSGGINSSYYVYAEAKSIYGSDYDKANSDNTKLTFTDCLSGSWGAMNYAPSENSILTEMIIKSGRFGSREGSNTSGIYYGQRQYGNSFAKRIGKIEGGWFYFANGGPCVDTSNYNKNTNYLYVLDGEFTAIFGGAGKNTSYGNRIVQMTGGKVNYSIFGGSNAWASTSDAGNIYGSSFVYIGGVAQIGGPNTVAYNRTLGGSIEAGSVFGQGAGGNNALDTVGATSNSTVIITDSAHVLRNVYGGSNNGCAGTTNQGNSTYTNVNILGGVIDGNVYGGGNNKGAGSNSIVANVAINMYGGTVNKSIFGGSRTTGTVYGSTNVNVYGGTVVKNVYGGGEGNPTYVSLNTNVKIGDNSISSTPIVTGSVYGGSAFGTVNDVVQSTTTTLNSTNVNIYKGVISNVYGGGEGSDTYTPYVAGKVNLTIHGGTITNAFGGSNIKGTPNGLIKVTLKNGTVSELHGGGNRASINNAEVHLEGGTVTGNVYGGSERSDATLTKIYLKGSTTTNIYGGSNASGTVNSSIIEATSGVCNTIYGGNNEGGSTINTHITVDGEAVDINTAIYGGSKGASTGADVTLVDLIDSYDSIPNVYGGGYAGNVTTSTTVNLDGATVGNIYGGSNTNGTVASSFVNTSSGTVTNIFGSNNEGGSTTTTNIAIDGGYITNIYGGGNQAVAGTSNVIVDSASNKITSIYGGGNGGTHDANVTTANITINNSSEVSSIYGGSNASGRVNNSYITTNDTPTIDYVYGGNNAGGDTVNASIDINGGTFNSIYGGGNDANTSSSSTIISNANVTADVFGGGDSADITNNAVLNIIESTIGGRVFGGGNEGSIGGTTNVLITSSSITGNIFGGGNEGIVTGSATLTINGTSTASNSVFGGGNLATVNNTIVSITNATITNSLYGGGNSAGVIAGTNLDLINSTVGGVLFGGGNEGAVGETTNVLITSSSITGNIYGGGNGITADVTGRATLTINGTTIAHDSIFGGGNAGSTGSTLTSITNATVTNDIFGGGNQVGVNTNCDLDVIASTVGGTIYGGGDAGLVGANTSVYVSSTNVTGSVYGGGNGATAVVNGNTNLNMDGTTVVGGHVFGGGNAANTGIELNPSSTSTVNIVGGSITGNVYGGANTAVLYGSTIVNIGQNAVNDNSLTPGDILIGGTVFGGAETNASGSLIFTWDAISVSDDTDMVIDTTGHTNFNINGSVFGSGNASVNEGDSNVTIRHLGTSANIKKLVSIQRATTVILDNCYIEISGAADVTNRYSDEPFSFSRVGNLKLKNNTTLYLERGTNVLESINSLVDINSNEVKASVTINPDTNVISKNVDNRIYIWEGRVINVATNEANDSYGIINGMTFFGMYIRDRENNLTTAIYNPSYETGDSAISNEFSYFSKGSYVQGLKKVDHDITIDGFYTNIEDPEIFGTIKSIYIDPSSQTTTYYRWTVGTEIESYTLSLAASKFSTLGASEKVLGAHANANAIFRVTGFRYNDLDPDVTLVDADDIPRIAASGEDADTIMSLVMETTNNGWISNGRTTFKTNEDNPYTGTTTYYSENSSAAPSLLFYLYHSKNLQSNKILGSVTISLEITIPHTEIYEEVKRANIIINLSRALFTDEKYEGTITTGKRYEMFGNTSTNVTTTSSISTYFSLYALSNNNFYDAGDYHALVSDYLLPINTKITMIDFANSTAPEYYYYVVNAADYATGEIEFNNLGEVTYPLSRFIKMGSSSTNNNYNDSISNVNYYDSDLDAATEEFIFTIDYGSCNITNNQLDKTLFLELRNSDDQVLVGINPTQEVLMKYNLYHTTSAVIDVTGTLENNPIYIGEQLRFNVTTSFTQSINENGATIYDTTYFNRKLGIKITIIDSNNNQVNGYDLMGVHLIYNGINYYPRMDGSYRINLADRVANVSANLILNTTDSNLASGNYTIKIESFASPDGIYYGLVGSRVATVNFTAVNAIYGLDVTLDEKSQVIDSETGLDLYNSNSLYFSINTITGLTNPNIRVSLERRNYTAIYSTIYDLVDLQDYVTNTLLETNESNYYLVSGNPSNTINFFLYTKPNLITGTYRIVFSLYDGDNYIGDVYKYIFIK